MVCGGGEQWYSWSKAITFDDHVTAKKVLATSDPLTQKNLVRRVRGFDQDTWDRVSRDVMWQGSRAKYLQNPSLKAQLFSTMGTTLVEASPHDTTWGIGLVASDPRALRRATWRGKNWLGEVLTELREELWAAEQVPDCHSDGEFPPLVPASSSLPSVGMLNAVSVTSQPMTTTTVPSVPSLPTNTTRAHPPVLPSLPAPKPLPTLPLATKGAKPRACALCSDRVLHLRTHTLSQHLPWYLNAFAACWQCGTTENTRGFRVVKHPCFTSHPKGSLFTNTNLVRWVLLMNGVFLFLQECLHLPSPLALVEYVVSNGLLPATTQNPFSTAAPEDILLMRFYEEFNYLPSSAGFSLEPPIPLIALSHWRILSNLLSRVSSEARVAFRNLHQYRSLDGRYLMVPDMESSNTMPMVFVDSHFHLDKMLEDGQDTLQEFENSLENRDSGLILQFGIANCVYPTMWQRAIRYMGQDQRVRFTFGIHPHCARTTRATASHLESKLQLDGCVGLGEIGLDHTSMCSHGKYCRTRRSCIDQIVRKQILFLLEAPA